MDEDNKRFGNLELLISVSLLAGIIALGSYFYLKPSESAKFKREPVYLDVNEDGFPDKVYYGVEE